MSILSKLNVAAAAFDLGVKQFLFDLFDTTTVTALGTDQATAVLLTSSRNIVLAADGTVGVRLPPAIVGMEVKVVNTVAAQTLKVYAAVGEVMNAIGTTAAYSLTGGSSTTFYCDANAHWYVPITNTTGTATSSTTAELNTLAGVTLGTSAPSKVLTTDAAESLVWATTDATAAETVTLSIADTRTGAGATGWAEKVELISNVALGSYANAIYGLVTLGASGKVTGLGSAVVGEMVLSAGSVDGTYACFEAELGMPSGAKTGTATSFAYLSVYGTDASTFDTNGFIFDIAGVTPGTTKVVANNGSIGAVNEITHGLRVRINGAAYYLLMSSSADFVD